LAHAGRSEDFREIAAGFWSGTRTLMTQGIKALYGEASLKPPVPPNDLASALATMAKEKTDALMMGTDALLVVHYGEIARLAVQHRLPTVGAAKQFVGAGGLFAYGVNVVETYRHAAVYVDKILRGARPGDLSIEQPTKFELVINLKTAKALGLSIPPSLLLRADQVIE